MDEMEQESMRTALGKREDLLQDFPDIEKQMAETAEVLYLIAGNYSLKETIFRSLLTGATLLHAKHKAAQKGEEDFLTRVMKKT